MGEGKTVKDLMDADVAIAWTGTSGKVTGNFPSVSGFEGFSTDPSEQTGHYFAFELDAQYEGREITVIGTKTAKARSRYWVIRLDALYEGSKKLTVKDGGSVIFDLDFTPATLAEAV